MELRVCGIDLVENFDFYSLVYMKGVFVLVKREVRYDCSR